MGSDSSLDVKGSLEAGKNSARQKGGSGEVSITQKATSITQQNQKALIPQVNTLSEANTIKYQLKAARDRVKNND